MDIAVIKKSMAPIYEDNKINSSRLSDEGIYGTFVKILNKDKMYYKVRTFYGYEGYIDKNNLEIKKDKLSLWNNINKVMINHNFVNINIYPDIKSKVIFNLVRGEIVGLKENCDYDKWVRICLITGEEGYIRKKFLKSLCNNILNLKENEVRENIVNTSLSYLNTQYKWGGKSCLGIDCSGLCFMSYLLNFIIINRDSSFKNMSHIKQIDISSIKKGDLIFFPGHVAIYIGEKKYIHSSSYNGVVAINSIDEDSNIYNHKLYKSIIKVGSIFDNENNRN